MSNTAEVVIIGNGFDIECGLPTRYKDFLDFTKLVQELCAATGISKRLSCIDNKRDMDEHVLNMLRTLVTSEDAEKSLAEWDKLLTDNWWIVRFLKADDRDGWIDFESQMSRYVRAVEENAVTSPRCIAFLDDEILYDTDTDFFRLYGEATPSVSRWLKALASPIAANVLGGFDSSAELPKQASFGMTYRQLKDRLVRDLDGLTLAFEKYLVNFVDKIILDEPSTCVTKLFEDLHKAESAYVVSFNFTRTFERLYRRKYPSDALTCSYIHGVLRENRSVGDCNLVFGIDEYLKGPDREEHSLLLPFRKYYRRIVRNTDRSYLGWVYSSSDELGWHEVTPSLRIFGHSLGKTDADVFRYFILKKNSDVTCYYHDAKSHADQVENLVRIIGMDEIQARTNGPRPSIVFVQQ